MTFTYGETGWRSVLIRFDRITWNPSTLSRENRYTFLKDRYGWVSGELTIKQADEIEAVIKQYFKNCEFRGTLPFPNKGAGSFERNLFGKTEAELAEIEAREKKRKHKTKLYSSQFTINLLVIFDTLEDDIQFAFLLNSGAIKIN